MTVNGDGPWFCTGRVSSGGTGSILSSYGRVGFSLVRNGLGQVTITMNSAHPKVLIMLYLHHRREPLLLLKIIHQEWE